MLTVTVALVASLLAAIVALEAMRITQQRDARRAVAASHAELAAMRRQAPIDALVKRRYVVTMRGGEGMFGGVLTEADTMVTADGQPDVILVFEQCSTLPGHDGDTPDEIAGRVILAMSGIAYMQQVS